MTLEKLKEILESTGLPVTYRAWPEDPNNPPPPMPYICFLDTYERPFSADGIVFYSFTHVQIEMYSELVDREAERRIKKALLDAGIFHSCEREYLESEKCYETILECEV